MQYFLIKDGVGDKRDFGNPATAASYARRVIRARKDQIVVARNVNNIADCYWMNINDEEYFREILGAEGVILGKTVSAATISDYKKDQKSARQAENNARALKNAGENARRVSHPKFGEGTVLKEGDRALTVLFDKMKKPVNILATAVETT
ncbi:hypothetical protein ACFPLB_04435 [Aquamicrobium segne]|uniref:Uncharacterized protein n=1 Tax=Aquamicrobium segne TaxID=469547 RepID=A0ABW0GXK2_9HYPH